MTRRRKRNISVADMVFMGDMCDFPSQAETPEQVLASKEVIDSVTQQFSSARETRRRHKRILYPRHTQLWGGILN